MFYSIGLDFVEGTQFAQVPESLLMSTKVVVDRVLPSKQRLPLQVLQER